MIKLNLTANTKEQEQIKTYLQNNASEILAEKINNGVKITKDNKTLINKKDLDGFMKFACVETKNLLNKAQVMLVLKIILYLVGIFTTLKKIILKENYTILQRIIKQKRICCY